MSGTVERWIGGRILYSRQDRNRGRCGSGRRWGTQAARATRRQQHPPSRSIPKASRTRTRPPPFTSPLAARRLTPPPLCTTSAKERLAHGWPCEDVDPDRESRTRRSRSPYKTPDPSEIAATDVGAWETKSVQRAQSLEDATQTSRSRRYSRCPGTTIPRSMSSNTERAHIVNGDSMFCPVRDDVSTSARPCDSAHSFAS